LVDPSHEKRIQDCQQRVEAIVSSMESLREKIVADCRAFFPTWYQQEAGKIVQMCPEMARAAGAEGLSRLGDEVRSLAGQADEIVQQTIAGDWVWIHRVRNPEQSRLDDIAALSQTQGDPTRRWLSEAVQAAAGRILPVAEKHGFQVAPQPPGFGPATDPMRPRPYPYQVSLPETIVGAARSYVQAAHELQAALRDLAAAKHAKLQAEAAGLWDRGDKTADPPKWEYRVRRFLPYREDEGDYRAFLADLNVLGDQGWELVTVRGRGDELGVFAYFKRPRL
jgi:hypothetical protein